MYKMYHWTCVLSLFIFSSLAVFVIVGGQPTIEDGIDDKDYNVLNQLINIVASLRAELAKLVAKNNRLEVKVAKLEAEQPARSGDNCT